MTVAPDAAAPAGLADLPLAVREAQGADWYRELQDGLTRRHLAVAHEAQVLAAVNLARLVVAAHPPSKG